MKNKTSALLIAAILVLTIVISPSINIANSQITVRTIPAIVSTEWLAVNLNIPNLVVLDVRSWDLYASGHIPGAVSVPESEWYANPPFGAGFPWMEMPSTQQLFGLIGNAGITKNSLVVVVGGTSGPLSPMPLALYSAAGITRVAITLLYAGITNVAILDGGYEKWVGEGRATSTAPVAPTPKTYTGVVKSEMIASKEYVFEKITKSIIVDSRDSEVYLGLVQEPWTNRTGHILSAKNLPTPWLWSINLDASGNAAYVTYKSYDHLEALAFDVVGSDVSSEVIVYCGVGGYASTLYFVLSEVLGYKNVKMYDGSAQEWSYEPSLPMASLPSRTLPPIVSTTWLKNNLNIPNLVVLDVRSLDLYNMGHIPGAINVPGGTWYANPPFGDVVPWMEMPSTQQLFGLIGNAGITKNSLVVVVGGTSGPLSPMPLALYGTADITRVAITLLYAGINNVAVLDGGYEKWIADGYSVETSPRTPVTVAYSGVVKGDMIVSKDYLSSKIGEATIVDARDVEVYLGLIQEPWASRPGHIPTAKSFPTPWVWDINVNTTTQAASHITYKNAVFLKELANSIIGADTSKEVIVYCGVGGYASTLYFVLSEVLGYKNVKMYDGSAQEWTSDSKLPVIYANLGSEYIELSSSYKSLQESYNRLESNYNSLQNNYNTLSSNYNKLNSDYAELSSAYDNLAKNTTPAYLTYIFILTTIVFLALSVYLIMKLRTKRG